MEAQTGTIEVKSKPVVRGKKKTAATETKKPRPAVKNAKDRNGQVKKAPLKNARDKVVKPTANSTARNSATTERSEKQLRKSLDATQLYLNEIGYSPLLTPGEEVHFARLARKGEEAGRKRMIESNLRLVVKIARRYINRG
ncbi:MAG: sigma-70 factor domain-containing protein, partial [Lysobacterales bacterium]